MNQELKIINKKYLTELYETSSGVAEWFGYYNYDVISDDGTKMLCNRALFDGRAITRDDVLELGWYDIKTGEWHHIDTTDSFNWQQGAMLQWIRNAEIANKVAYNKSNQKHFYSIIYDLVSGEKKEIPYPVYAVTRDGNKSISLNYERSYWCRAYHYQSVINPCLDVRVDPDDGIFSVDLLDGTVKRIVDINDVISCEEVDDFKDAKHWIEHIMISKSSKRISFLHRYSYANASYSTRLFVCDIDGSNLQIIDGWKSNEWSHFGWKGDDEFVIYSVKKNPFQASYSKSLQKAKSKFSLISIINKIAHWPIFKGIKDLLKPNKKCYMHFKHNGEKFVFIDNYDNRLFGIDGHPSFTMDGKYMITDSYPDNDGFQHLIVFNTINKKGILLGKIYAALNGNPASCDLHPKLSFKDSYIVVDSAYTGKHKMIVFQINWEEIKKDIG